MPNPLDFPDQIQIQKDVNDVFVTGVRKISDFPLPYQELLKEAYRFSATRYNSNVETHVNCTLDTLDII
jgi:hypothetical protein